MAVFQLTWTISYAVGPALVGVGLGEPLLLWTGIGLAVLGCGAVHVFGPPVAVEQRRPPAAGCDSVRTR
jgi:hypothetical protein